ncbi:4Fe-4S binding protein [Akkermansiaceae bacterium]|nr:4Fe-4S binding protein [Akkermansiaceae bacterium]
MDNARSRKPQVARRIRRWGLGAYRLALILAALACLRISPRETGDLDPARILAEAKAVLPAAESVGEPSEGLHPLLGKDGEPAGWATSTLPQAEEIIGYSGTSELLVIFDPDRRVKAVRFLSSQDTDGHVAKVRGSADFWSQWSGKPEAMLGERAAPLIVSGATLTSEAMARGVAARFGAKGMDQWFPESLRLADVEKWFPGADAITDGGYPGSFSVRKGAEDLGSVLRSSRMGVSARGFNGTSDVIVALDREGGKVLGIGLLGSRDNEPYVGDVGEEVKYADGFAGKNIADILAEDPRESPSLFTSGASYTNSAVVASVSEMLRRHIADGASRGFPWKSSLALAWIALGVGLAFHESGKRRNIRTAYAAVSVVAGLGLGWMVSQDQIIGWGANGLGLRNALPLLVLTAVALLVPAFTGKNVYCSHICPHGAAQTLAGRFVKKRFHLPPKLHAILVRVPWLTLLVIWALAFLASGVPFAYFEPFETWSSGYVAFVPAAILTLGILSAFFLPQGYCHYGCPTGALLKFLTHSPSAWTRRDTIATLLIATALLWNVL